MTISVNSIAVTLHILAATIWIGGMFFAYVLLRPALGTIDPNQRLTIWANTLKKFFPWVWLCIVTLLATGFLLISLMGGFSNAGIRVYTMMTLAVIMMAIFKFVYVAPFKHLCRAVEQQQWEVASFALGTIRTLVATNLVLGMATIVVAVALR